MRENPSHQRFEAPLEALQPAFPKDRRHEKGQEKEGQEEEEEVQGSAPIFHTQNLGFAEHGQEKLRMVFAANQAFQVGWSEWQKTTIKSINSGPVYHCYPQLSP